MCVLIDAGHPIMLKCWFSNLFWKMSLGISFLGMVRLVTEFV
jgi:hypothetical protein